MPTKEYFEFCDYLKSQGLPEFPTFLTFESYTQESLILLKEMHSQYIHELLPSTDQNKIYIPYIFDFITTPIRCKEIKSIKELLNDQEEIQFNFHRETDFKTAAGTVVKAEKIGNDDNGIDNEHGIESKIIQRIKHEILMPSNAVKWDDIVGLTALKETINEIVVWPMLRPDIFKGLRNPFKGLLLFGPPGTGKTMIGRCVASQCNATFFSISASSLTSKWVGEGEKMVRALFSVAKSMQPSVIFIDEIDSLLTQRSDNENEASRKIKTEFLVQFDGAKTNNDDKILVIGATNRPHEIDEAARRRLVKRIYVPLPETEARREMITKLISEYSNSLTEADLNIISEKTDGYSGSDMYNLCREAAMEPIREIFSKKTEEMRKIDINDFKKALTTIRKSVSVEDLDIYIKWNQNFGSVS